MNRLFLLLLLAATAVFASPLPYPQRSAYHVKALQPDYWHDKSEIAGNNAGGVIFNLVC